MIKKLFLFSLYIYIILVNYLTFCNAKISDKRLCADPECSSILSYATTLLRYIPSEDCMISFPANVKVNIFAKGAGERKDLWEIGYNGKRGYAPSNLLRETQILKKGNQLIHEVPTQCMNEKKADEVVVEQSKVEEVPIVPASAVEPFDMIDGTKIFNDEVANITDVEPQAVKENIAETPNLLTVPQALEDQSPSAVLDDSEDDDYEGDDFDDEEIDNEDEDEKSEEIVDRDLSGEVKPSNLQSNIESGESTSESIINVNVSSEVENEIKINETENLPSDPEGIKPESVTESVSSPQPETTTPTLEEPSKSEEIMMETHSMLVTEIPNEIPRPILDNQILLETTTATPFLERITESMPKETVQIISESSSKPEEENSTNETEIISGPSPVPSVEENNANAEENINKINEPAMVEEPILIKEKEFEIQSESIEPEQPSESNPIGPETVEEVLINNKIPVAYPPLPPLGFYKAPEKSSQLNPIGPEPVEEKPIVNEIPITYPPPPPPGFYDTPSDIKAPAVEVINVDNKIEDLDQIKTEEVESLQAVPITEDISTESIEEPSVTEDRLVYPPPPPPSEIPLLVIETPAPDPLPLLQETIVPSQPNEPEPESPGLFASIYAKLFGSGNDNDVPADKQNLPLDDELERILYPEKFQNTQEPSLAAEQETKPTDAVEGYCENLSPNSCPQSAPSSYTQTKHPVSHFHSAHTDATENCTSSKGIDYEEYVKVFLDGILQMKDFIIYLIITAATVLAFMFGYYCINNCRKESPLINNLNVLERSLMVSKKENALLLGELDDIRQKLASIEDNSFGSNEMVIALKNQLEDSENQKIDYQLQVAALEKELESATDSGLELNRMFAELLNNQSGSESIISSVEELQKQLNEQQETILSINTTLADKSRENSELQVFLYDQKKQFDDDLSVLQSVNEKLTESNGELNKKLTEMTETLEVTVNEALKSKSEEIVKLNKELSSIKKRYEDSQRKLAKAESRCQVVDEYLKNTKKDSTDAKEVYDLVQLKSEALAAKKEKEQFRERLEGETDARKLLEDHLKVVSEEVSNLKKEYNVAEKEKVEAQTRLEVLSGYFKEKETQLQKELSIKEAMWLQQQGEKTSTIERVQSMQDQIQNLKSQNDALRAEIEAQAAAHKTQIATLDSRAHEEWLNAKQAKRKLEEVRVEAAGLRRKLTTFGEAGVDAVGIVNGIDGNLNAPSPILMVGDNNPGASLLGVLPPPPFMPPPFMGPPPPFMPPPFMPGEMRPPPLGRLMSPPPNRYSPGILDDRDRYSPNRSPSRYSPDARYNYNDVLSPYETETDFSPPPSPPPRHGGYRDNRGYKAFSPPPLQSDNRNKKSKGGLSSGSTDSLPRRRGGGGGGDNAGSKTQNGSNKV